MKNFGINYIPLFERSAERFALDNGKAIVVGYDVAHPGPATPQVNQLNFINIQFIISIGTSNVAGKRAHLRLIGPICGWRKSKMI